MSPEKNIGLSPFLILKPVIFQPPQKATLAKFTIKNVKLQIATPHQLVAKKPGFAASFCREKLLQVGGWTNQTGGKSSPLDKVLVWCYFPFLLVV